MMRRTILCVLAFLLPLGIPAQQLSSPDGKYCMTIDGMSYSVTYNNKVVVEQSRLGVDIDNRLFESALAVPRGAYEDWCSDLELRSEERTAVDTTWMPLYGENARIRDHFNQLTLHYEKGSNGQGTVSDGYDKRKYYAMDIIVRAYDEGIAFRYHFPETSNGLFLHVTGEQTTFKMPEGTRAWYEEWAQGPYQKKTLGDAEASWYESERPLLLQLPNGMFVALLEAGMKDYARGKFRLKGDNELQVAMYGCADIISPYDTPWRVIMVGEKAVDLINNKEIVLNLNGEHAGGDWSWVRPGKAFRSTRLNREGIPKGRWRAMPPRWRRRATSRCLKSVSMPGQRALEYGYMSISAPSIASLMSCYPCIRNGASAALSLASCT